jgi:hypothetical protein
MTTKLAEKTQEVNTALLKLLEKDRSIKRLSEQLESKPSRLIPISPFSRTGHTTFVDSYLSTLLEIRTELNQSR